MRIKNRPSRAVFHRQRYVIFPNSRTGPASLRESSPSLFILCLAAKCQNLSNRLFTFAEYKLMNTIDGIHTLYEGDVQYPYADVGASDLLHISSVTQENRRDFNYTCPCCQKRLRPRLGNKNRHCFFHDKGSRCSMDKYIHDTAERLLKENGNETSLSK